MFTRRTCLFLALQLALAVVCRAEAPDCVRLSAEGIAKIRSYDVLYGWANVTFPEAETERAETQRALSALKHRDVFAFGVGRRYEQNRGTDNPTISVIDWQTAASDGKPAQRIGTLGLGGTSYLDYVNPVSSGLFLSDLLADTTATIRPLDAASAAERLIGFEVRCRRARGPLRVWVDPGHGYMPSIIDEYIREAGRTRLYSRTRVKEFLQVGNGVWAPIKGTYENVPPEGLAPSHLAILLAVDVQKSSWNSIKSAVLFTEASMPPVNFVNHSGYKQHLPPSLLEVFTETRRLEEAERARLVPEGTRSRLLLLLGINAIAALGLALAFWWRRMRRRAPAPDG
jgi:hypothetical protein